MSTRTSMIDETPGGTEPVLRVTGINKTDNDNRKYCCLKLANELKVLLVHDPHVARAVAALSVRVGYMSDPQYLPGLAHFCEHMLFLGTEKYPEESSFRDFLSKNNGSTNASTTSLTTCYHFSVSSDKLVSALDRFVQFFISPLFSEDSIDREVNAIHSEHEKNMPKDNQISRRVFSSLAKDHPISNFGCGNLDTLQKIPKQKNIDVRRELFMFHRTWYSANLMSLVVIGNQSINELEAMVNQHFLAIPNKRVEIPSWSPTPFSEEVFQKKIQIVPNKSMQVLSLYFVCKDHSFAYKSNAENYLLCLLGHESKGSIMSELQNRGWATALITDQESILRGFGIFEISIELTKDGFKHVDDIILLIFQYMKMLKIKGPQKWFFDEMSQINELRYQFQEKSSALSLIQNVQNALLFYPFEEVLSAPYFRTEWNPRLITEILEDFDTRHCIISIMSPTFKSSAKELEQYYRAKYSLVKVPGKLLDLWDRCELNSSLSFPSPNLFVAENYTVYPMNRKSGKDPIVILNDVHLKIWYLQDIYLNVPKSSMSFVLLKNITDPVTYTTKMLFVRLFKNYLAERTYDAALAGLKCKVYSKTNGLVLSVFGYSEKQRLLLNIIFDILLNFQVDKKQFNVVKETAIKGLKNFENESPVQMAIFYSTILLSEHPFSNEDLMKALDSINVDKLKDFCRNFFKDVFVEGLLYGNIPDYQARDIAGDIQSLFLAQREDSLTPMPRQSFQSRELQLLDGDRFLFAKESPNNLSCTYMCWQFARQNDRLNVMVELLSRIMVEPCFATLRTQEQLGYIVQSGLRKSNDIVGFFIVVQSQKHPAFVESRIKNFLSVFKNNLMNMDVSTFENFKVNLVKRKSEVLKNVLDKTQEYFHEIILGDYHFSRRQSERQYLNKFQKKDLLDFYTNYVDLEGRNTKILSVLILSKSLAKDKKSISLSDLRGYTRLDDVKDFKKFRTLFSLSKNMNLVRNFSFDKHVQFSKNVGTSNSLLQKKNEKLKRKSSNESFSDAVSRNSNMSNREEGSDGVLDPFTTKLGNFNQSLTTSGNKMNYPKKGRVKKDLPRESVSVGTQTNLTSMHNQSLVAEDPVENIVNQLPGNSALPHDSKQLTVIPVKKILLFNNNNNQNRTPPDTPASPFNTRKPVQVAHPNLNAYRKNAANAANAANSSNISRPPARPTTNNTCSQCSQSTRTIPSSSPFGARFNPTISGYSPLGARFNPTIPGSSPSGARFNPSNNQSNAKKSSNQKIFLAKETPSCSMTCAPSLFTTFPKSFSGAPMGCSSPKCREPFVVSFDGIKFIIDGKRSKVFAISRTNCDSECDKRSNRV